MAGDGWNGPYMQAPPHHPPTCTETTNGHSIRGSTHKPEQIALPSRNCSYQAIICWNHVGFQGSVGTVTPKQGWNNEEKVAGHGQYMISHNQSKSIYQDSVLLVLMIYQWATNNQPFIRIMYYLSVQIQWLMVVHNLVNELVESWLMMAKS